ncbi:MAG: NTP transferase domain-containing protein [Planctomycetes bacterium]|nr:NTP transferase domain-containing protein [Phycisphaerae bacterium]NBB96413.1 NTP transferase domain-containing protein [Planctomycetota bacterium]
MKGVVLAGGLGTRLRPLTETTNKHLLPVYDRPMIHYPLDCLRNAGIDEVVVVTNDGFVDEFRRWLGDGTALGLRRLGVAGQTGEGGIADALLQAEPFIRDERICVILGDNIIEGNIIGAAHAFRRQRVGARVLLKAVRDPHRFGIADLRDGRLVDLIEKPSDPPSNLAVTGIYFYDAEVFDLCRRIEPSARGELEITDVNKAYLQKGTLEYDMLEGWWTDAGTFESLTQAWRLVSETGANHANPPTRGPRLFDVRSASSLVG